MNAQGPRAITAEAVVTFAQTLDDTLAQSAIELRQRWADNATVLGLAADQRWYQWPADCRPEEALCVFSVTEHGGPTELEAPIVRWLGNLAVVPREDITQGPFRAMVMPDRLPELAHLRPVAQVYQMLLDNVPPLEMPAEVVASDRPPAQAYRQWLQLWREDQALRGAQDDPGVVAVQAGLELGNPRARWFALGDIAVAQSRPIGDTHIGLTGAYVDADYRHNGYGAALVQARLADGYARGYRRAISQVTVRNTASLANLARAGFRQGATVYIVR